MAQTTTATTNFNQTVVALVRKQLEELLRAPLPYTDPANYLPASFVKGTNNTFRFINIPDMSVVAGTVSAGTLPWLTEGVTPTAEALSIGYEEFSAAQAGRVLQLTDVAMLESPFDLMSVAAERVARNAIATANQRVAEVLGAGANIIYAGGLSPSGWGASGTYSLTGALVKQAVARLADSNVPTYGDGTYHAIVRPTAVFDLMSDTSVGGWIDAARYAGARQLMTGELGEYAGVRFQSSASAYQVAAVEGASLPTTTGVSATGVFTSTAHGLRIGDAIVVTTNTGGTGFTDGSTYYVVGPVTANTFRLANTKGGAAKTGTTNFGADITDMTAKYKNAANVTSIFGPGSYAFGDWGAIQTYFTPPGGPGDELHQRASVGWKGFFGAVILGEGTNATNVTAPRYVNIQSAVASV